MLNNSDRIELKVYTNATKMEGVITPFEFVSKMKELGYSAVAITDYGTVQAFPEFVKAAREIYPELKIIFGIETDCIDDINYTKEENVIKRYTLLAKREKGLHNIYDLITLGNFTENSPRFKITKTKLVEYKKGLIIGGDSFDGICDYVEISPSASKKENIELVKEGKSRGIPVVAVGNVFSLSSVDELCREALCLENQKEKAKYERFLTTQEMLNILSYLGEDAYSVVVENSNIIANMVKKVTPIPERVSLPKLKCADEVIQTAYEKLYFIFGKNPPKPLLAALENETKNITDKGYKTIFFVAMKACEQSRKLGFHHIITSGTGKSFISFLLGISGINPLPPHYYCPFCKTVEIDIPIDIASGQNLENKSCLYCGGVMNGDGQNTFAADYPTIPHIKLYFSAKILPDIQRYVGSLFGENMLINAGETETIGDMAASEIVDRYGKHKKAYIPVNTIEQMVEKIKAVKKSDSVREICFILPLEGEGFYKSLPLIECGNAAPYRSTPFVGTQFQYESLQDKMAFITIGAHDMP